MKAGGIPPKQAMRATKVSDCVDFERGGVRVGAEFTHSARFSLVWVWFRAGVVLVWFVLGRQGFVCDRIRIEQGLDRHPREAFCVVPQLNCLGFSGCMSVSRVAVCSFEFSTAADAQNP